MNLTKLLKTRKGMAGLAAAGIVMILALAFVVASVSYVVPVMATHTAILAITPSDIVQGNTLYNFTLNVENDASSLHPIHEVRLYHNESFSNYVCKATSGWYGPYLAQNEYGLFCLWTAQVGSQINPGEDEDFDFSAVTPETECGRQIRVETRDKIGSELGDWNVIYTEIAVDKTPPLTTKSFIGPNKTDGYIEWIDGVTLVELIATDDVGPHDAGIDKTWYKNELAHVEPGQALMCWNPEDHCKFVGDGDGVIPVIDTPYDYEGEECINSRQDYCTEFWNQITNGGPYPSWEACVESLAHSECGVPEEWHLYVDGEPFPKDEESCHILYYFSVDNVANYEDVKLNCFFVDKTPPEVDKEVGTPKVDETNEEEVGDGKVSWTTSQYHSGTSSVELSMVDGTQDWAGVDVEVDIALEDIYSLTFWELIKNYTPNGWSVNVILGVDSDGDGVFESDIDAWHVPHPGHNPAVLGDDTFIEMDGVTMNPATGVWTLTDAYNTAQWWTTNAAGDGLSSDCYKTLGNFFTCSDMKANLEPTDHVKLIKLEIGGSGSWSNEIALVDELKLNGQVILDDITTDRLTWVTNKTDITFTCTDQEPHPSGDEEVCFKVSYDLPEYPTYITTQYCTKYAGEGAHMEEDWCCVDASPEPNSPFVFNFDEESFHDLEYYCMDAVEKKSDIYIQYYKVDDKPPYLINKWIDGPYYEVSGDCPPNDPSDVCHLDGDSYIDILVEDGQGICVVDDVWCQWGYYLDQGQFYGWYSDFPIQFPEETRHDLVIECYDALGNKMVDEETFYVDKTAPETTKTYVGPQYPVAVAHPTHITSETEVHLSATDDVGQHDSGVAVTYYRDVYLQNPEGWQYCYGGCEGWNPVEPQNPLDPTSEGWVEYTGPFQKSPESCHIIEYYSVDNVDKVEQIKWQCVFVDNTIPTLLEKQVGEPKLEKEGKIYISGQTPITMRCQDQGDHPVNDVSLWYRYRFAEDCDDLNTAAWVNPATYCGGGYEGDWCDPNGGPILEKTIYFTEDSCHELEYYCVDALGHETEHEFEIDVVDSQAPEINKTIVGPSSGDCLPVEQGDICFVDNVTEIIVNATDPAPHPVDEVLCNWSVVVTDVTGAELNSYGELMETPPFSISFPEESYHELTIECYDALGNFVPDVEVFEADHTPPEIHKEYGRKYYYEEEVCVEQGWFKCKQWETVEWITRDRKITITVDDAGPHKSGIKETKYRYDIVDDDYCWGLEDCEEATTDKNWTVMSDPKEEEFYIGEDSCHLIEIVSTDNVEKTSTHKQCVFVDNRGPDTVKTIGEPKDMWTPGENGDPESYFYPEETEHCWDETGEEIECWEVTTVTPIRMECDDSWDGNDTHPVGEKKLCFKVDVDGEDKTLRYCMEYGGWYNLWGDHKGECCRYLGPDEDDHDGCDFFDYNDHCDEVQDLECYEGRKVFYFLEETEHNLKYYCIDQLGNEGPVDEEKFKVEGTKLEIPLYKKWNLISVPFTLLNDDPEVVFDKVFWKGELVDNVSEYIDSVWAYDPDNAMCDQDWCVWSPGDGPDNLKVWPGWGYWVMVNDKPDCEGILDCFFNIFNEKPLWLVIGGSLFSPATTPPSRNLQPGWNLIGYYGTDWQSYPMSDENLMCGEEFQIPEKMIFGDQVYCSLNSLIDTQEGYPRWSSLWSFVNCGNHDANWIGLNTCADPDSPMQTRLSRMYAGRGYWLEMDVADIYAPATTCLWNDDFECVWTGGPIIV